MCGRKIQGYKPGWLFGSQKKDTSVCLLPGSGVRMRAPGCLGCLLRYLLGRMTLGLIQQGSSDAPGSSWPVDAARSPAFFVVGLATALLPSSCRGIVGLGLGTLRASCPSSLPHLGAAPLPPPPRSSSVSRHLSPARPHLPSALWSPGTAARLRTRLQIPTTALQSPQN